MPDKRLAPGFRQVDAFGHDERYERDENGEVIEEISYVTLYLGAIEPTLVPSGSTYCLIVRGHNVSYTGTPKTYARAGLGYADPISSALWDNLSGYIPVTARD